jgi:ankyrin repeat protein
MSKQRGTNFSSKWSKQFGRFQSTDIAPRDFSHDREGLFWLLDHGADINRTDEDRRDSDFYRRLHDHRDYSLKHLNRIAGRGDIQSFNDLVSRGANPHLSIALHRASKCQDAATCVVMIDNLLDTHHMDIEADNELFRNRMDFSPDSGTPLNCALYYQNIAAIKHLLKRGANPESAVSHAIGTDYFHAEFLPALGPLLDAGANPDDALELAATRDDIEAAAICLSRGANPRPIIESQEARTARKALKRQLGTLENDDDPDHMDDHMDERDWSKEMETFLKFVDAHR